jgi:release factor glutamine methyltransferase
MNEVELLFTDMLNCDRMSLYQNKKLYLDKAKSSLVSSVLKRRMQAEPIQYILGKTEFLGLEFKVTADVFIPRPETEILVEQTINTVKLLNCQIVKLLDIGTGSGCIAISLAKLLTGVKITATDISEKALNIAKENAKNNNVVDRIMFLKSNLFESLPICHMPYAICVCNPPYIPTVEIETLQPEVRYEPHMALDGGKDGLDFYRRIIDKTPHYLRKDGFLIMEMGFNQKEAIKNIFQKSGYFEIIEFVKDYNNVDRVIVARNIG